LATFAVGQTFPGTGTVTSVGSCAGLTGGPITGSGTLSIPAAGVTDAMLANPYSGAGTCAAGSFVTKLTRNAAPTCAAGNLGTVTSVGSGAGLTGGPITGSGTLSIASTGVTNAMLLHPSLTVTAGTGLTGGGAVALGGSTTLNNAGILGVGVGPGLTTTGGQTPTLGIDTTVVPELSLSNVFTTSQFVSGYLNASTGNSVSLFAYNTSTDSTHPALYVENDDLTSGGDPAFQVKGPGFGGNCTIDVSGNLLCSGTISPVVKTSANRQIGLYTVQSSENWVEDYGRGALANGVATLNIDHDFAETVSSDASYHVFLTPRGDCEGLYVTNATATSFEVHELRGGKSSVQFDYRIVAHRKGFEAARLPDVTARFQSNVARPTFPEPAVAPK